MNINPRPNILLVIADQMTASMTSAYGHPVVKTPTMDQLCQKGVRFDCAYTSCPLCAPSRSSIMSGQYASNYGVYDNGTCFPANVPTFAHVLRLSGYEVVLSGKMHFIGPDQLHGIEKRLTTDIYPAGFNWCADWDQESERQARNSKGNFVSKATVSPWSAQLNYDEEVQFQALNYLRNRKFDSQHQGDPKRPFCLIVSYSHPHSPFEITPKYYDPYKDQELLPMVSEEQSRSSEIEMDAWLRRFEGIDVRWQSDIEAMARMQNNYFGMIRYVDDNLGELLTCMDELGLRENTAIVFTSDHGEMLGDRGFVEKRLFYERSARVPLIASYPRLWKQQHKVKTPVSLIDLYPTFADLAGEPVKVPVDGQSLTELLNGKEAQDRMVFSEYHGEGVEAPCAMVRFGNYKYVIVHGGRTQLFDLEEDPFECVNLSGEKFLIEVEKTLHAALISRFDLEAINLDVRKSQIAHRYIHEAMQAGNKTHWDFAPDYPACKRYIR